MAKKQTIPFEQWLQDLEAYASKQGYSMRPNGFLSWELDGWQKLYDQGCTPPQAWEKM